MPARTIFGKDRDFESGLEIRDSEWGIVIMGIADVSSYLEHTFRIECILGSGGSGAVYKAWHLHLQKHVVIKEVMHCSINSIEARRNEVEALKMKKSAY